MKIDLIISNAFVLTMEGKGVGMIENGAVGIKGNRIIDVGLSGDILDKYTSDELINASGKVVMPGLINSHIHSCGALFRGMAQDISNWLTKGLWPLAKFTEENERVKGSFLSILEGVKSGTTTFCDFDTPMSQIISNYAKIGARARVAHVINELNQDIGYLPVGELYPFDRTAGENRLKESIQLIDSWHGKENGRITCLFGPQAPDMLSIDLLLEVKRASEKYDTKIHMHLAQGEREMDQMLKRYNKRSIPLLDELGYLNNRLMAVHLTVATKEEIKLLVDREVSMVNCACALGIIDGAVPPGLDFWESGGIVALGTDSPAGNNSANIFDEMKFTSILNKVKRSNPTVLPAWLSLRMSTVEAAKAIGLEHEIGTLTIGKKADLIIIDMNEPGLQPIITSPIRNIVPNLVYSAKGNEVQTVIIDGKIVMDNRKILTVNENQIIQEAQEAAYNVTQRAKHSVIDIKSDLVKMTNEGYI